MDYDFRTRTGSSSYDSNTAPSYNRPPPPMYGQPQSSMYPKIGAGASPRNPPFQPAPNPPSSGTEPEYRITPPPQLLPQVGEVPRSNFHFDFEFERNVLAEAVKENPNWARLGIDIVPPKATQPNSSPYGPTADPVVSKYTSAGLNRDAVALAIANYGDNPTKKERKRGGMEEDEGRAEFEASREIEYVSYSGEHHLPLIMDLVDQELSEPYSIFTYRYFVYQWPNLSFLAFHNGKCVGTVVSKMGDHRHTFRGYIAMLVVLNPYRGRGIATELVARSVKVMMESGCEEVTLEAEVTNKGALALYGRLGFIRAKRLFRYYLNGVDAFRLKLMFPRLQPNYYIGTGNQAHPDENYEINNKSQ